MINNSDSRRHNTKAPINIGALFSNRFIKSSLKHTEIN
uniref:Uncharacterized protein n=1 Tax=Staphylococcus epidermidis TaxID=1282 RepID=A0A6C0L730_STAEP|nr:hypothetical protein [Staphylococcus epidermidis]QHU25849.1 hypothetical protein [Staphylococcus epidermidis]